MSEALERKIRDFRQRFSIPDVPYVMEERPELPKLTPEEQREVGWRSNLILCRIPPVYMDVPQSLAVPAALADWQERSWSLSLLGPTGCGKTWLAVRMLGEIATRERRGRFADASLAVEQIKREFGTDKQGETFAEICSVPILLLDDLGAERGTDFQVEQLGLILRARYNAVLPTIVTSNAKRIDDVVEARIASRLAAGVFSVSGRDRRLS